MHQDVLQGYLSAAETASKLLALPGLAERWEQPSVLEHWSVAGLAGHLARAVFTVHESLISPTAGAPSVGDAVAYYAAAPVEDASPDSEVAARIRVRGLESAGTDATDLLTRYVASLEEVRRLLATTAESATVSVFGQVLTLREWLRTRTVEIVVHSDDLSLSVGCSEVVFSQPVFDDVIGILAGVASRRRGAYAVLRALARTERAADRVSAF